MTMFTSVYSRRHATTHYYMHLIYDRRLIWHSRCSFHLVSGRQVEPVRSTVTLQPAGSYFCGNKICWNDFRGIV